MVIIEVIVIVVVMIKPAYGVGSQLSQSRSYVLVARDHLEVWSLRRTYHIIINHSGYQYLKTLRSKDNCYALMLGSCKHRVERLH